VPRGGDLPPRGVDGLFIPHCGNSVNDRFFSSFARNGDAGGMAGQELTAEGAPVASQVALGIGPYTCLNNAADTRLQRILTVWEGLDGKSHSIRGRIFASDAAK
jgi:hypothetical protein